MPDPHGQSPHVALTQICAGLSGARRRAGAVAHAQPPKIPTPGFELDVASPALPQLRQVSYVM